MKKWVLWTVLLVVILPVTGFGLWTWGALKYSYSSGERSGYVQKISKKGWICKTWEGELAMVTMPGVPPQLFAFSVPDDAIAKVLTDAAGKRVSIHYEQKKGVPGTCFGETEYFVTGARVVE
ncbi:6-phosphogluconate dehydrogenase [Bryobacterales bacterium F-183]|nr:6-phosphogluconate dehydrogenase [Bryobacterales bacterium F-183]